MINRCAIVSNPLGSREGKPLVRGLPAKRRGGDMSFVIRRLYVCPQNKQISVFQLQWAIGCRIFKRYRQIILFAEWVRLHEARDIRTGARFCWTRTLPRNYTPHRFLGVWTMATETQGQHDALSSLNTAIGTLNRANGATSVAPAKAAFTSARVLLTMIRVSFDPVHVGRLLANVCRTRWLKKRTTSNWG